MDRFEKQRQEKEKLAKQLKTAFLYEENDKTAEIVFKQAWEEGHSSGVTEVALYYETFANMAKDIIKANQ